MNQTGVRRAWMHGGGDVAVKHALLFGVLAAFIGAVYVGVVVGAGRALFGASREPHAALSIAATIIVAATFRRARRRAERWANRIVYGERVTPLEAITHFSERVAVTYATQDVLPPMARILAEGTGAARADVWLRVGGTFVPSASWPADAPSLDPVPVEGGVDSLPGARAIAVRHQAELLGAFTIAKHAGEPVTPAEDRLLADLASQAGLVLRNVRLTTELSARLDEIAAQSTALRASRQRIVAAQDAERRALMANIHDGAQQHLVALAVQTGLCKSVAAHDPVMAREMLETLRELTAQTLETLHVLAAGIYPPLLEREGLVAALRAHATSFVVTVDAPALGRLSRDIEAAVYFTCLEALQNIAKYAGVSEAQIRIAEDDDTLSFSVLDRGKGFDPVVTQMGSGLQNMRDRVAALGGALDVTSAPGDGTVIRGSIPVRARVSA